MKNYECLLLGAKLTSETVKIAMNNCWILLPPYQFDFLNDGSNRLIFVWGKLFKRTTLPLLWWHHKNNKKCYSFVHTTFLIFKLILVNSYCSDSFYQCLNQLLLNGGGFCKNVSFLFCWKVDTRKKPKSAQIVHTVRRSKSSFFNTTCFTPPSKVLVNSLYRRRTFCKHIFFTSA